MAQTSNTFTGDGTTVLFPFTFPYIETTDIKVSVDGVDTTEYTLDNATTVRMNVAPSGGSTVRVYRQTDDTALEATFYPGSVIRATDLNADFEQVLYIAQETREFAENTDASSVQAIAQQALDTANQADVTATQAETTANAIAGTANAANTTAAAAETKADTAIADAATALSAANNAVSSSLQKSGGTMTGQIAFTPAAIADGVAWSASANSSWTFAGGVIANPTNQAVGQQGLIYVTGAVTGFGDNFTATASAAALPYVLPYYVAAVGEVKVGSPVEV